MLTGMKLQLANYQRAANKHISNFMSTKAVFSPKRSNNVNNSEQDRIVEPKLIGCRLFKELHFKFYEMITII